MYMVHKVAVIVKCGFVWSTYLLHDLSVLRLCSLLFIIVYCYNIIESVIVER